jgi:hypothetical protein
MDQGKSKQSLRIRNCIVVWSHMAFAERKRAEFALPSSTLGVRRLLANASELDVILFIR